MTDYFSQEHLLRILTRAPNATWRWDVDVSLEAAVRMARFAHDYADVHGTFYVAATLPTYNPFSDDAWDQLNEIVAHGHRLGVHVVDPDSEGVIGLVRSARVQGRLLHIHRGDFAPRRVSFHKPRTPILWRDLDDFESAYAAKWEGRYLSDARRRWDAEKDARVADDMQINLHPEHWDIR